MLALAHSAAMLGIDGYVVRVEADSSPGTPAFALIGLPDRALGEARDRVRAALINSGYRFPTGKVLVNLAPAEIRKIGPGFDLPIALALLALEEHVDTLALQRYVALGELALDGTVRRTRGVLPMAIAARNAGFEALIVPRANASEAALVDGVAVYAIDVLHDAVALVLGHGEKFRYAAASPRPVQSSTDGDFGDVCVRRLRNARSRLRRRAAITCYWSDRPAAVRRCSRSACPRFSRACRRAKRSRLRRSIASPVSSTKAAESSHRARFVHRIIPSRRWRCAAAVRRRVRVRSRSLQAVCFSSTNYPNFHATR